MTVTFHKQDLKKEPTEGPVGASLADAEHVHLRTSQCQARRTSLAAELTRCKL